MTVTRYVRRESRNPYRTDPNLTGPTSSSWLTSHHVVAYVMREQATP